MAISLHSVDFPVVAIGGPFHQSAPVPNLDCNNNCPAAGAISLDIDNRVSRYPVATAHRTPLLIASSPGWLSTHGGMVISLFAMANSGDGVGWPSGCDQSDCPRHNSR